MIKSIELPLLVTTEELESIEKPLTVEGLRESVKKFRQFMGYRDFQLYVFIKDDVDGDEDK